MPSTLACPGLCPETVHTCPHNDWENVVGDGQAGMTYTSPLAMPFCGQFFGRGPQEHTGVLQGGPYASQGG